MSTPQPPQSPHRRPFGNPLDVLRPLPARLGHRVTLLSRVATFTSMIAIIAGSLLLAGCGRTESPTAPVRPNLDESCDPHYQSCAPDPNECDPDTECCPALYEPPRECDDNCGCVLYSDDGRCLIRVPDTYCEP